MHIWPYTRDTHAHIHTIKSSSTQSVHLYTACKFKCLSVLTHDSEKAMAPHSSTLAWKIPWTEEPGGLLSMGSHRVGHDWATSLSLFTFMHWRRKWQPTPVFLPEESQGRGSLVGCRLWGCTESDTTDAPEQQQQQQHMIHSCHRLVIRSFRTPLCG